MKANHEQVEQHLSQCDNFRMSKGGQAMQHNHKAMEAMMKQHGEGMHGYKHYHEEVKKLCGGGM